MRHFSLNNTYFLFLGDVCQEGLHRKSGIENAGTGEEKYYLMDICFRYHIWTNETKISIQIKCLYISIVVLKSFRIEMSSSLCLVEPLLSFVDTDAG